MKSISVITPCRNEEENVEAIYEAVRAQMAALGRYRYEHIFIDNASTDRTVDLVRGLAKRDRNVKLIVNSRNFGQTNSPMHALTQARGDAVIGIVADFQDPPELIPEMIVFGDAEPYMRGMIAEIGLPHKKLVFDQPRRRDGVKTPRRQRAAVDGRTAPGGCPLTGRKTSVRASVSVAPREPTGRVLARR